MDWSHLGTIHLLGHNERLILLKRSEFAWSASCRLECLQANLSFSLKVFRDKLLAPKRARLSANEPTWEPPDSGRWRGARQATGSPIQQPEQSPPAPRLSARPPADPNLVTKANTIWHEHELDRGNRRGATVARILPDFVSIGWRESMFSPVIVAGSRGLMQCSSNMLNAS